MNLVVMMGRLTRDPEVRYSAGQNGTTVANFSIAVDRRFKREGQQEADFFDCVTFGKQAEFVEKYLHKGIKVVISGSMQNNNYQGRDGQMIYRNRIVLDSVEFAESKAANDQHAAASGQQAGSRSNGAAQQRNARTQAAPQPPVNSDGFMNIPDGIDEELPFV